MHEEAEPTTGHVAVWRIGIREWVVATTHHGLCIDCANVVDRAVGIATVTGSVSAKAVDGGHAASVTRRGAK